MANQVRQKRVADRIRAEISELLAREMADPRLKLVTVTDVSVDRELAYASVWVCRPDGDAAEKEGVSIRLYDVIYRVTEDIEKALKGMLEPEYQDVLIGKAEVRQVFRIPKIGNIAGSYIREGEARRNATARVMRGGQKLYEGKISSLKHEKDDVREVRQGFECGIGVDGFESFRSGDIIEFYTKERVE